MGGVHDPAGELDEVVRHFAGELAAASGLLSKWVETVVRDELARGRITLVDGHLELAPERFPPGALAGLRQMTAELAVDEGGSYAKRRNGRPTLGWSRREVPADPRDRPGAAGAVVSSRTRAGRGRERRPGWTLRSSPA